MNRAERDTLLALLDSHELIIEYRELEKKIVDNPEISAILNELHVLQKKMVLKETILVKERYQAILQDISSNADIIEFLAIQQAVNSLLQMIVAEITDTINSGRS